jgi:hypothetical protein
VLQQFGQGVGGYVEYGRYTHGVSKAGGEHDTAANGPRRDAPAGVWSPPEFVRSICELCNFAMRNNGDAALRRPLQRSIDCHEMVTPAA